MNLNIVMQRPWMTDKRLCLEKVTDKAAERLVLEPVRLARCVW